MISRSTELLSLLLFSIAAFSQGDDMFRENPSHNNNDNGSAGMIYNKIAWQFNTGAAIRSTALVVGNSVYIGSSDRYLYALTRKDGALQWKFDCGSSVSSSPAYSNETIYILSEQQVLVALQAATGKLEWTKKIGEDKAYLWGFDYYFSSPVIKGDSLFIASADGKLFCIDKKTGNSIWEKQCNNFIRATPAVVDGSLYIGDTNGDFYAFESSTGKQQWVYKTYGSALKNDTIGFDRKAIISSAIIEGDAVVFGGRDGFLYCLNKNDGSLRWTFNHEVSWVISSPSINDGYVITGTSDGHFVQSVDIKTGKEKWRTYGTAPIWSSPLVIGDDIYIGGNDGVLFCLDKKTGKKAAHPLVINAKIFSSPVVKDDYLYFGADNGTFYCLQQTTVNSKAFKRYVFWYPNTGYNFFRNGVDLLIKDFLTRKGYKVLNRKELASLVDSVKDNATGNEIVFASSRVPDEFLKTDSINVLHDYLQSGGIIVSISNNALFYNMDDAGNFGGFDFKRCASIIGIHYPENDLRSLAGIFSCTATKEGKAMGMKEAWTGNSPVDKKDVDVVLGIDEKGRASAWIKKNGKGYFLQLWIDQQFPEDYNYVDDVIASLEKMY